jgi:hypothetical protein
MTNQHATVCLVLYLSLTSTTTTRGQEKPRPKLPPRLQQVLRWLPEDSETLVVANGPFQVPPKSEEYTSFLQSLRSISVGLVIQLQNGLLQEQLKGRKVLLAVEASRRFTSPKGLGMMPYEGCQILLFDESADNMLQAAMESGFEKAPLTIQLANTKVAAFTEKWEQNEWSLLVTRPQPGVLLCATDRKFLEQVLARMNQAHKDRAFPENLPEWQHVSVNADVWALRHYRNDSAANDPSSPLRAEAAANVPDSKAVGFVFCLDASRSVAKARYLTGAKDAAEIVRRGWHNPPEKLTPTIMELKPGVVEISQTTGKNDAAHMFLFALLGYLGHAVYL